MKAIITWTVLLLTGLSQAAVPPVVMRQSQQLTVIDPRPPVSSPGAVKSSSGRDLIKLDADVLLLSAGRIKEALTGELEWRHEGAGKIRFFLYRATTPNDLIGISSGWSPDGWDYQVEIPDQIEGDQLVRGVVHVLLLEFANRGQGPKAGELPLWLVEGMTAHLLAVAGTELVIGSVPTGSMLRIFRERRGLDYLKEARQVLRAGPNLSFADLAHPKEAQLTGDRLKTYQCSAQLFVYELLHTKRGPAGLVAMLRELPRCWNWEIAFLRGFAADFPRMLDVEKKWAVDVLAFTANDPSQVRSRLGSLDQLDDILSVPAQVRMDPGSLPERMRIPLRQFIATGDSGSQNAVLRQKLGQLQVLRRDASPDLVPLIDSYFRTLAIYLQKKGLVGRTPENRMQATVNASLLAQETLKDLDQLDKRRASLSPENVLSVNSNASH